MVVVNWANRITNIDPAELNYGIHKEQGEVLKSCSGIKNKVATCVQTALQGSGDQNWLAPNTIGIQMANLEKSPRLEMEEKKQMRLLREEGVTMETQTIHHQHGWGPM